MKMNPGYWPGMKAGLLWAAINNITLKGDWAEFGVWKGDSARFLLRLLTQGNQLHLYDSFEGLPEDWSPEFPKGKFALSEPPTFDDARVVMHKGWFKDTITSPPPFFSFVHVDCDLYSSTVDILSRIFLPTGLVIVFDEFPLGEEKALKETGIKYITLYESGYGQTAVKLL
jgi:hypothetical protein